MARYVDRAGQATSMVRVLWVDKDTGQGRGKSFHGIAAATAETHWLRKMGHKDVRIAPQPGGYLTRKV